MEALSAKGVQMKRTGVEFVSLFCGCGGFDQGLIQAGFHCRAAFDIDPLAVQVHRQNLGDIATVSDLSAPHVDLSGLQDTDVMIAGPPCQGFSTAGKRILHDPRNDLLLAAGRIAKKIKPKVFVAENVMGVAAGEHRKYWTSLEGILRSAGYETLEMRCDLTEIGVAQTRKRAIMVAWRSSRNSTLRLPKQNRIVLRDVLTKINGASNHHPQHIPKDSYLARIARHIAPGQKLCNVRGGPRSVHTWDIPDVFGITSPEERTVLEAMLHLRRRMRLRATGDADPVLDSSVTEEVGYPSEGILVELAARGYVRRIGRRYDLTNTFNGKFRRLLWDEPSPTVDTRFTEPRYFLHPDEQRGMTVREAARIQGFPDSFVFSGPEREQCRMIGNAVPPPLGYHLGVIIRQALIR